MLVPLSSGQHLGVSWNLSRSLKIRFEIVMIGCRRIWIAFMGRGEGLSLEISGPLLCLERDGRKFRPASRLRFCFSDHRCGPVFKMGQHEAESSIEIQFFYPLRKNPEKLEGLFSKPLFFIP